MKAPFPWFGGKSAVADIVCKGDPIHQRKVEVWGRRKRSALPEHDRGVQTMTTVVKYINPIEPAPELR